ncbi:MAG: hypothetical protein ACREQ5_40050, partial [Candidatus Dormibacteria bacterium]
YDLTHSAWFAGVIGSLNAAFRLALGMPPPVVADARNRRDQMLLADMARALAVSAFVLVLLMDRHLAVWALVLMICIEGPMSALFVPSEFAVIRRVVARPLWSTAFSRNEGRTWSASVVGPLVAGALYAVHWGDSLAAGGAAPRRGGLGPPLLAARRCGDAPHPGGVGRRPRRCLTPPPVLCCPRPAGRLID